jgi:transcription elongation factor GreA
MNSKQVILTYEGLRKLEDELEHHKRVKRREIAERIKHALSFGDISENSEYDEAKNEQAHIESRISHLETILKNAKVIDDDEISAEKVSIGSKVKILFMDTKEELSYHIVGSTEADPSRQKISNESPVGSALMDKKAGEVVEVIIPDGKLKIKILEINK